MKKAISTYGTWLLIAALALGVGGCGHSDTVHALAVVPSNAVLTNGATMQLSAVATLTNGTNLLSWNVVAWTSADPNIATVDATGKVVAVSPGSTMITATDIGHPELTSSATLTVTKFPLVAVAVTPAVASDVTGSTRQFNATGTFADGSTLGLTTSVTWGTSNATLATFSTKTTELGLGTAVAAGTVTVSATDPATGIAGHALWTITKP